MPDSMDSLANRARKVFIAVVVAAILGAVAVVGMVVYLLAKA